MDLRFSLIGLLIGFLIGLTGMGGGSLMTPIMILVMGVKPVIAVGTDLAYGAVTKIVGASAHLRQGTVNRRVAYLLSLGSVPASVLGVALITDIKRHNPDLVNAVLVRSIGGVLIFVGAMLVLRPTIARAVQQWGLQRSTNWRDDFQTIGDRNPWVVPLVGAVVGFLVGLTSVGSGTLIIVSLLLLYPRWDSKDMVGTDVFQAAVLVSAASIAHFVVGNVNVPMMTALLLGSIPGVLLGSRLAVGFPEGALRMSLATVLFISGVKLL